MNIMPASLIYLLFLLNLSCKVESVKSTAHNKGTLQQKEKIVIPPSNMKTYDLPELAIDVRDFGAIPGDGVEDTEAFQRAIDAASQMGTANIVSVSLAGEYLVNQLSIKQSNLSIFLGSGVILKKLGVSEKQGMFTLEMPNKEAHFYLHGQGTIDLNRKGYKDNDLNCGVFAFGKEYITIEGVSFKNSTENFLKFFNCSDVEIRNAKFDNAYNIGIEFNFPASITKSENYTVNNCTFSKIDDNSLGRANGVAVAIVAAEFKQEAVIRNVSVSNCKFTENLRDVHFELNAKKVKVQNAILSQNISRKAIQNAFAVVGVTSSIIRDNYIEEPGIRAVTEVNGNTAGIIISTVKSETAIISNNIILDKRKDNQTEYGILVTGGKDIFVASNYIQAGYNAGVKIIHTSNSIILKENTIIPPLANVVGVEVYKKPKQSMIENNVISSGYSKGGVKVDGRVILRGN